jgi:fimbrial chaperone protein
MTPARASSLQVDPVRVEISAKSKVASVRVKNGDGTSVTVRIHALIWTQENGVDVYRDVSTMIVSPPIVTIKAGATQLVRVGMRGSLTSGFYRLMIEEVPQANPEGGIRVSLNLNLPLFVLQKPGPLTALSWSARQQADMSWILEASNRGNSYVRIEPGDAARLTGLKLETNPPMGVVLPNSSRRWTIGKMPEVVDRTLFQRLTDAAPHGQMHLASRP